MMKIILLSIISVFIAAGMMACTLEKDVRISKNQQVEVSQAKHVREFTDPAIIISLVPDELFSVALESNPSTGFSWQYAGQGKPGPVILLNRDYELPKSAVAMPGVPGKERFTFKARDRGDQELVFYYLRPWEKDVPPDKTAAFKVHIR